MRAALALAAVLVTAGCGGGKDPEPTVIVIGGSAPPTAPAVASVPPPAEEPVPEPDENIDGPETEPGALEHFQRGQMAYNLGNYQDAIDAFKRAYELQAMPAMLYNIGQAYRQLGDAKHAVFFFERYLALEPDAKNRTSVEKMIAELEQQAQP